MAKRCKCPRRTCAKRKGGHRFTDKCKGEFRSCMRGGIKAGGSTMKQIGSDCMTILHQCDAARGHYAALRRKPKRGKYGHRRA